MSVKVAIFCALEEEVRPLTRSWKRRPWKLGATSLAAFQRPGCLAICAGMGAEAARRAAQAVLQEYRPEVVVSAGFAGALVRDLKAGKVLYPAAVVDEGSGRRFEIAGGKGILVSVPHVAGPQQKPDLAARFGAQAVDMEGASLAQVAAEHGVSFVTVKVITDELDFALLDFSRFTGADGQLRRMRVAGFALLRPWLWPQMIRLAVNCSIASKKLCRALEHLISEQEQNSRGLVPAGVAQPGREQCR